MTKNDVEHLLQFAVRECAAFLKIQDFEWKGARELIDEIKAVDSALHAKLKAFIGAYEDWFTFTDRLIAQGGASSDSERALVLQKSEARDSMRSELLVALGRK